MPRAGGSHGSRGGSRGGYHGSHGSHSSMGRGTYGYSPYRHSPIIVIGGGRGGYYNDNTPSGTPLKNPESNKFAKHGVWATLLIILAIFSFFAMGLVNSLCNPVNGVSKASIEEDYTYYHNMITLADNEHIVDGTITYIGKYSWSEKYYFKYEFTHPTFPLATCDGYIYSVFSEEEIADYQIGDTISIAVENSTYLYLDSIPVIFEDYQWQDDGEIGAVEKWSIINTVWVSASVVALVGGVVLNIYANRKIAKLENEMADKVKEELDKEDSAKLLKKCAYCGSVQKEGATTCPNCGSSKFK